ncbi:MAG TPA: hypothetical protein PKL31_01535 [Fulvivirga sp.]|nr:hypothetical protein [Fulvivirga sp.]
MKILNLTIILLLGAQFAFGQNDGAKQKIENAKIAIISERLNLTPEQAQQFWPLYNEFLDKRRALRQDYDNARAKIDLDKASEKERKELIDYGMKLKERSLTLEKQYSDRMLTVISAKQIMELRQAEDDFKKMLLRQIERRRIQEQRRDNMRDDIQQRRKKRDNGG